MYAGKSVFSQVIEFLPLNVFHRCVARYNGNFSVQTFSCLDQFLCLVFAQLTYRESLRDIEACLRSQPAKPYHMGFRSSVARNTLANANAVRNWRIYADIAQYLIKIARKRYQGEDLGLDIKNSVYALDSTTIDLCLTLCPWALFRSTKSGIKLHTLLDLRGNIPSFLNITPAKVHDVNTLDLHHGQSLSRLCPITQIHKQFQLLCDKSKIKSTIFSRVLHACGQTDRLDLRPTHPPYRPKQHPFVSSHASPRQIQSSRDRQATCFFDKQLLTARLDHHRIVPSALASGTLFQMDQAKPQNQNLLRQ
jgi:hypothetical protein